MKQVDNGIWSTLITAIALAVHYFPSVSYWTKVQIIIDREAREIMYLVATVRPSVRQGSHG